MIAFGVGEVVGSYFIAYIIDRFGNRVATAVIELVICLMMGSIFAFLVVYEFGAWAVIMCFMWGFHDSTVNTHV